MNRRIRTLVVMLLGIVFAVPTPASAFTFVGNNAYRAVNFAGVRYGSVRMAPPRRGNFVRRPVVSVQVRVNSFPRVINQRRVIVRYR